MEHLILSKSYEETIVLATQGKLFRESAVYVACKTQLHSSCFSNCLGLVNMLIVADPFVQAVGSRNKEEKYNASLSLELADQRDSTGIG